MSAYDFFTGMDGTLYRWKPRTWWDWIKKTLNLRWLGWTEIPHREEEP